MSILVVHPRGQGIAIECYRFQLEPEQNLAVPFRLEKSSATCPMAMFLAGMPYVGSLDSLARELKSLPLPVDPMERLGAIEKFLCAKTKESNGHAAAVTVSPRSLSLMAQFAFQTLHVPSRLCQGTTGLAPVEHRWNEVDTGDGLVVFDATNHVVASAESVEVRGRFYRESLEPMLDVSGVPEGYAATLADDQIRGGVEEMSVELVITKLPFKENERRRIVSPLKVLVGTDADSGLSVKPLVNKPRTGIMVMRLTPTL